MKITEVVTQLIQIPRRFRGASNVSMYSLLEESGYFQIRNQVSVHHIRKALAQHPEYIDDWMIYSTDKRCGGWYIEKVDCNSYIVGYFGNGDNLREEYGDQIEACAAFIGHEVEAMDKRSSLQIKKFCL